jgi:IS30 family transposase
MAARLERNVSSISREVKRNRFGDSYVAICAQSQAEKRKLDSQKRHPLKDPVTYAYVLAKLREGWSPEQICGRLDNWRGLKGVCLIQKRPGNLFLPVFRLIDH